MYCTNNILQYNNIIFIMSQLQHVKKRTVVIAVTSKLFKVHDMKFHITKHHHSGKIVHFSAVQRSAIEVTQSSILPKLLKSTGFSTKIK